MDFERLKTAVLLGDGVTSSSLAGILPDLHQLEVIGQLTSPEDLSDVPPETMPELLIVDLDSQKALPDWLEKLNKSLPHTTVMVCSQNRDPDFLIHVIQMGIHEFLPLPLQLPDLEAALERIQVAKKQLPFQAKHGQIIVVTGLKGGMGVTSIAVNLAVSLAEMFPKRVVLVDLGRPFPDVATFLDQKSTTTTILDLVEHSDQLDVGFVLKTLQPHRDNFSVLHGANDLKIVDAKSLGNIWDTLRTLFDWVVVDLSAAPDVVNQKTLQEALHVLILTDLLVPNLENLKRWWEQYEAWQLDRNKVKVIVNRYQKNEGVVLDELVHMQKHPVFFTLPNDYLALSDCINHGVSLKELAPRSKLYHSLQEMAAALAPPSGQAPAQKKKRFWFF